MTFGPGDNGHIAEHNRIVTEFADVVRKGDLVLNAADYGAVGDGVTNDTSALQDALAAAGSLGQDLLIPSGTYVVNSGLTWKSTRHSVYGGGNTMLDFRGMTSGYAITCSGSYDEPGTAFQSTMQTMSQLGLIGTRSDATVVDGIICTDTENGASVGFRDIYVYGFRDQWFYGDSTWCISQERCTSLGASRYCVNLDGMTNAGENYQFSHCIFANATNAAHTAIGVYTRHDGHVDATFTGCSFDYCDILIDHNGGAITLNGCHLENNRPETPMIRLQAVSGSYRTYMTITGGQVAPTESGQGRPHLIEVKSGSVDHVFLTTVGVPFEVYDKGTVIFKNLASAAPTVLHMGGSFDGTSPNSRPSTMGVYTSLLVNGDMESSTSFTATSAFPRYPGQDWAKDGAVTYTFDTGEKHSGTRSVKMVGTGTVASTSLKQMAAVIPGRRIYFTAWIKTTGMTAGSVQPRLSWYLDDATTRTVVAYGPTSITANQDWTPYVFSAIVPAGIRYALVDFLNTNLNGTGYVDDVTLTLL